MMILFCSDLNYDINKKVITPRKFQYTAVAIFNCSDTIVMHAGLEIFFQTNLSCRACAPKN